MTTLGPSTDYTGAAVTQGGKKTFIAAVRALIADRLGVGYNLAPENVASASNVDLSALNTRQINLTGTTTVDTVTAPIGLSVVAKATGAITLKAAVNGTGADIALAAGDTWTWRATAADTMEVIGLVHANAAAVALPVRQTVFSGPVDTNGQSAFGGSTGSTTVTAAGTLIATAANGFGASGAVDRVGSIVNPSWIGLSTNGTMFLYLDIDAAGVCTPGAGTLAPTYRSGGADVTTNNQFTFNYGEMVGKVGNGAAAAQSYRVYVGEVTVAGGVVTVISWYALNGRNVSADAALPGGGGTTNFPHNIGVTGVRSSICARCNTTSGAGVAGQVFSNPGTQSGTAYGHLQARQTSRLSSSVTVGNSSVLILIDPATGSLNSQTAANFTLFLVSERPF